MGLLYGNDLSANSAHVFSLFPGNVVRAAQAAPARPGFFA
jgi:hypothetical protein